MTETFQQGRETCTAGDIVKHSRCIAVVLLCGVLVNAGPAFAGTQEATTRLKGNISPLVAQARQIGPLDKTREIHLAITLPLRNQTQLDALLKSLYTPGDPLYGKYLQPEAFTEQFGPTQADYDAVIAFAKQNGLRLMNTHANRAVLDVAGAAGDIEQAFGIHMMRFQATSGRLFHAPDGEPILPASIAAKVAGVIGLDDAAQLHPQVVSAATDGGEGLPAGIGSDPSGGLTPSDIRTAYNLNGITQTGAGQTLAVVEFDGYDPNDITAYVDHFGLSHVTLENVLVNGFDGNPTGDPRGRLEVTLDIQLMIALAPGIDRILVYEASNLFSNNVDLYNRIASDNRAKQISASWGANEIYTPLSVRNGENAAFQQMAAQGQSVYVASGDYGDQSFAGKTGADNILWFGALDPASQPYVVAVGGTTLTTSGAGGTYSSETAWRNGWGSSGGGISTIWAMPSYQSTIVSPGSGGSSTHRNVPDVSLNSDPDTGYVIFCNGDWSVPGGTSCAAPLWAAYTALVNQRRTASGAASLGFPNPSLYYLARSARYAQDFHDITSGNNGTYPAVTGYDNVTGWGSFNGGNLFTDLSGGFTQRAVPGSYATIQAAITAAGPGDEVVIADGTYEGTGNKDLDFGGKAITVRSASGNPANCIIDCESSGRGFNFHSSETAAATVSGLTIRNGNPSNNAGAGMYIASSPTITNCVITACTTTSSGSGMYIAGSPAIASCQILSNQSTNNAGGGMYIGSGNPVISNCLIQGNTGSAGGGIYTNSAVTLKISNCTISGNTSTTHGGGIGGSGTVQLIQCTISNNTATNNGGGIRVENGTWTVRQCTLGINSAGAVGGGISRVAGTVSLFNTLVACNKAVNSSPDLDGAFDGGSHNNLVGILDGSTGLAAGSLTGSANTPLNPRMCLLANNGGSMPTHALLVGSPAAGAGDPASAIDANGNPLTTDQRGTGHARFNGSAVDIGAFEGTTTPSFTLTGPAGVALSVGTTSPITWNQAGIPAESIIRLYYDPDAVINNGNELWTTVDVDAGAANGSYTWAPILLTNGTYYIGGYVLDPFDNQQYSSRLSQPVTITAQGTTYVVNTLEDVVASDGRISLREALMSANNHTGQGDAPPGSSTAMNIIQFDPSLNGGTITLSGFDLPISENVWVQGPGSGQLTIDAAHLSRIFYINGGSTKNVWINGLQLINGNAVTSSYDGSGIWSNTPLTLEDVTVSSCGSSYAGTGAGAYCIASLTARNCTFSGNGGTNTNTYSGGGLYTTGGLILGCTFCGNKATSYYPNGGGIYQGGGSLTIANTQITGNTAYYGGGVFVGSGTLFLQQSQVSGNTCGSGCGAGIYNSATLIANYTTCSNNSSTSAGGGVYSTGTLTATGCTISGNTSTSGAGVYVNNGTAKLIQVTISGNAVTGTSNPYGAGVRVDNGTTTIRQSTIANNSTTGQGGGVYAYGGTVILYNTIVAGNTAGGAGQDVRGSFSTSSQYNLIGIINDSIGLGNDPNTIGGTLGVPVDAKLGALGPNGGPTSTQALLSGSPAVDRGSSAQAIDNAGLALVYDQRGSAYPRIVGSTVDIGATEATEAMAFHLLTGPTGPIAAGTPLTITWTQGTTPMGCTIDLYVDSDGTNARRIWITRGADLDSLSAGYIWYVAGLANPTANYRLGAVVHAPNNQTYTDQLASTFSLVFGSSIYTVDSLGDLVVVDGHVTLREALQAANLNQAQGDAHAGSSSNVDVICFSPSLNGGTISLTGFELPITDSVWIQGPGSGLLTIDAKSLSRVFNISGGTPGKQVWITGVKIANGTTSANGGGIYSDSPLTLDDVIVSSCHANNWQQNGGGIYCTGGLTARNSVFSGNSAQSYQNYGGGIYCTAGGALDECTVSGNGANSYGGLFANGGTLLVSDSQITGNNPGGICIDSGSVTLQRCRVTNNTGGAGISVFAATAIRDTEITGNSSGGIYMGSGSLTMDDCAVASNTGGTGAGLYLYNYNNSGTAVLSQVTISGNAATNGGYAYGGGVRVDGGTCTLRQCTVAGNSSTSEGGGVYCSSSGTATLYNTIVAGNTATGAGQDVRGSFSTSSQSNLIGVVNDSIGLGNDPHTLAGVTGSPLNAMLSPLAENGGYTATQLLLVNSPAIDTGSNALALDSSGNPLQYDQRGSGLPRIYGSAVDIGAAEYVPQASNNQPPAISSLSIPGTVHVGDNFTLTAIGAADDHGVASVSFYRDINGNGLPEPNELLGTDTNGADGWSCTVPANWTPGQWRFLAIATDDGFPAGGAKSSQVVSAIATVLSTAPPQIVVGTTSLQVGRTDQRVPIYVHGQDRVTGLNFTAVLGNGTAPGAEPLFVGVDYTGSIWASSTYMASGGPVPGQTMYFSGAIAFSNPGVDVQAEGLLMTLILDTRNMSDGQVFNLSFTGTGAPTPPQFILNNGQTLNPTISNGTVSMYNTSVVGRYVFYNYSPFDGNDPTLGPSDDAAIATDKSALLPGNTATFANYTSYNKGINGIMIDIQSLQTTPTLAGFSFLVGNNPILSSWTPAPAPNHFLYRPGAGTGGSGRVEISWPDNSIVNKWLQVRVSAASIGLNGDDVFYFGNAIGESGNSSTNTFVDGSDIAAARDNFNWFTNPFGLTSKYDYSRDKYVDAIDMALARDNQTNFLTCLQLITPGVSTAGSSTAQQQAEPLATGTVPITIDIGTIQLRSKKAGQQVQILATAQAGAPQVSGFNLRAQIGNGAASGNPSFQAVNFTGGLWDSYQTIVIGGVVAGSPQYAQASVLFSQTGQMITPDGLLATLTIDTTGLSRGQTYDLKISSTNIGQDTDFITFGDQVAQPTIVNGTIQLVALLGDVDDDGAVILADLKLLVAAWNSCAGGAWGNWNPDADFDQDGCITLSDLKILVANWNRH